MPWCRLSASRNSALASTAFSHSTCSSMDRVGCTPAAAGFHSISLFAERSILAVDVAFFALSNKTTSASRLLVWPSTHAKTRDFFGSRRLIQMILVVGVKLVNTFRMLTACMTSSELSGSRGCKSINLNSYLKNVFVCFAYHAAELC